ncbi:uncharacterized membrane-anchored protein YjiN (DUF445 family) [Ornithinimicrobium humiphilum]|uniref:Uncharacterized membrane-anchored protein YjiN (DUF445 family) n=1 Tax=Ornithinimicrobium humiphilum TaxID=125288 RepID=A0A543KMT1_9MICO|nr:uncharacterized membrane-anchored protein YjiN (DUF445 family) [Ornithinimicrobium humiphilum]
MSASAVTLAPVTTTLTTPGAARVDDETRRAGLRRMRTVATGLLVVMAVIYVLTHGRDGAWGFVNAAAEAGMVGAIADWFAVVALFRHPLGLPIPHTALVRRRKDDLGDSLEQFVTENFLTPDVMREKYLDAGVVLRLGEWVGRPENADRVVSEAVPFIVRAVERIDEDELRTLIDDVLLPRVKKEPLSPMAGHLLERIVEEGSHRGLVDLVARELHAWLALHEDEVQQIVRSRAPSWAPTWVNDQVTRRVYQEVLRWARDVKDDQHHNVRAALDSYLTNLASDLQHDPRSMAGFEALKERLLDHPEVSATGVRLGETLRSSLLDALTDPEGHLRTRMSGALSGFGQRIVEDAALRERLDSWTADLVVSLVERYGPEITSVISGTIRRWDAREASDKIELHVGRDLQFIRLNGTVVGALVGLVIHSVSLIL